MLQRETFLLRFFTSTAINQPCTVAQFHLLARTTCSGWAERAERRV